MNCCWLAHYLRTWIAADQLTTQDRELLLIGFLLKTINCCWSVHLSRPWIAVDQVTKDHELLLINSLFKTMNCCWSAHYSRPWIAADIIQDHELLLISSLLKTMLLLIVTHIINQELLLISSTKGHEFILTFFASFIEKLLTAGPCYVYCTVYKNCLWRCELDIPWHFLFCFLA